MRSSLNVVLDYTSTRDTNKAHSNYIHESTTVVEPEPRHNTIISERNLSFCRCTLFTLPELDHILTDLKDTDKALSNQQRCWIVQPQHGHPHGEVTLRNSSMSLGSIGTAVSVLKSSYNAFSVFQTKICKG